MSAAVPRGMPGSKPYIDLDSASTKDVDLALPTLAKDPAFLARMDDELSRLPTSHRLRLGDARDLSFLSDESVHLIVTSPPYWTLKKYNETDGQLGSVVDYAEFQKELNKVWQECLRVLVPGGRLVVVVGDVVVSRRAYGRHKNFPLHADIQVHCERIGFDNLTPILWAKIANASFEAEGNSGAFLGKPFEPGGVVKNDVEFILMFRKSGGYRSPSPKTRLLSIIAAENHRKWFTQVWTDIRGASLRDHPAPFPPELAERLIRMFSFAGDTILDPFAGTGSTMLAAMRSGRNSIGLDIDREYLAYALERLQNEATNVYVSRKVAVEGLPPPSHKSRPRNPAKNTKRTPRARLPQPAGKPGPAQRKKRI